MPTRLVERLERDIAQCEDPYERECLKAQLAAVIARLGQLDRARFALSGLKTQARRHAKPGLQAWVHFVSGSIHYFSATQSPAARTEFQAARDQAIEGGDTPLRALACAWLAAVEMQFNPGEAMLEALGQVFQHAAPDHHAALSRAWVVMANMADFAGQYDESLRWYERARLHAAAEGDSSAVSLVMYNRGRSLISHHVRRELFGLPAHTAIERVVAEIESTSNLDFGLGNQALASFAQVVHAEALTVVGNWSAAVMLLDRFLDRHLQETSPSYGVRHLAHRAWCLANLGQMARAMSDVDAVLGLLDQVQDADDLAVAHQRVANTLQRVGQPQSVTRHEEAAAAALQWLAQQQSSRRDLLFKLLQAMQEMGRSWPQD